MFTHVCVSANDLDESRTFYAAVLAPLGVQDLGRLGERMHGFGKDGIRLLVTTPRDGQPATYSNGGTISFAAPNPEAVDAFHAAGLAHGGKDDGAPGPRHGGAHYGAYLRDPAGNKICAFYGF